MKTDWDRVSARIESYVDDIVALQTELVACPALGPENGGQGELEKSLLIRKWLERLTPDQIISLDAPDDRVASGVRPNLVGLFKGRGTGRVWILSHMDVVPPGELSLWSSDPWTLRRDGDRIYGRGVEDNHQGIVASYFAMKALRDENLEPGPDVGLIFVADEETGSQYGLAHLLRAREDLFLPEDLIIVPDSGDPDGTMIEIAEKSMAWIKFTVTGQQCHASTPQQGRNTLRATALIITAVDEALHRAFDATDKLYHPDASTFEPTKKEANVPNINTIPGEDIFYFDARVLPCYQVDEVLAEAARAAEAAAAAQGVSVKVEPAFKLQAPPPTSVDAPVVKALERAVARRQRPPGRADGHRRGNGRGFFPGKITPGRGLVQHRTQRAFPQRIGPAEPSDRQRQGHGLFISGGLSYADRVASPIFCAS